MQLSNPVQFLFFFFKLLFFSELIVRFPSISIYFTICRTRRITRNFQKKISHFPINSPFFLNIYTFFSFYCQQKRQTFFLRFYMLLPSLITTLRYVTTHCNSSFAWQCVILFFYTDCAFHSYTFLTIFLHFFHFFHPPSILFIPSYFSLFFFVHEIQFWFRLWVNRSPDFVAKTKPNNLFTHNSKINKKNSIKI